MTVWRRRPRRPVRTEVDVAARPVEGDRQLDRQAVSPEQFDRPPVYLAGRA